MVALPPAAWMRSSTSSSAVRRPGDEDDVRAGRGERFGGGGADAAAGAGDERELAGEWLRIGHGAASSGLAAGDQRQRRAALLLRDVGQRWSDSRR